MNMQVIGVHEVEESDEPCHLIEMEASLEGGLLDLGAITQEWPNHSVADWQMPYDEHVWDEAGNPVFVDMKPLHGYEGLIRIVFFFHYLQLGLPLRTPVGDLVLPAPSPRPPRLAGLRWESPW